MAEGDTEVPHHQLGGLEAVTGQGGGGRARGPALLRHKERVISSHVDADHLLALGHAEHDGEEAGVGALLQPRHPGLVNGDVRARGGAGHKVVSVQILDLLHVTAGQLDEAASPEVGRAVVVVVVAAEVCLQWWLSCHWRSSDNRLRLPGLLLFIFTRGWRGLVSVTIAMIVIC